MAWPPRHVSEFEHMWNAGRPSLRRTRDYVIRMPKDTTVKVACEAVRCENWLYGWDTIVDERTPEGRDAAAWIRRTGADGRTYRELPGAADGGLTVFRFGPHQRCFAEHRTKPARWLVAGGSVRQHADMHDWIEDLDEHVGSIEEQLRRG